MDINAEPPKEHLFDHEDRLLLTGLELERVIQEVAGAVSVVFMAGTDIVMPEDELSRTLAVYVAKTGELWEKAGKAAPSKGPALGFDFNAVKPPGVVALTGYVGEYQGDPALEHAHTVIDNRGDVIKDPNGRTGRRVTEQERAEALVTFPQKRYVSTEAEEEPIADNKTIILMTQRRFYNQQIVNDADVVIDKDGYIVKNRYGHAGWVGSISAGPQLLEEATPVFPDGWNPMLPPTDPPALGTGKPEDGFALDDPLTPVQRFALLLVALALGLSIASFVIAVTGH